MTETRMWLLWNYLFIRNLFAAIQWCISLSRIKMHRRDLLKMIALLPATIMVKPINKLLQGRIPNSPHVILIVFDAWSVKNVSLYGYQCNTMPNLEKFAKKAIVYNQHYANGNYTIPNTKSFPKANYARDIPPSSCTTYQRTRKSWMIYMITDLKSL